MTGVPFIITIGINIPVFKFSLGVEVLLTLDWTGVAGLDIAYSFCISSAENSTSVLS